MANMPLEEESSTKFKGTISNITTKPHTHIKKGGGGMGKGVFIPTFQMETLDQSIQAELSDLFINQLVKVALDSLDNKNTEKP